MKSADFEQKASNVAQVLKVRTSESAENRFKLPETPPPVCLQMDFQVLLILLVKISEESEIGRF